MFDEYIGSHTWKYLIFTAGLHIFNSKKKYKRPAFIYMQGQTHLNMRKQEEKEKKGKKGKKRKKEKEKRKRKKKNNLQPPIPP